MKIEGKIFKSNVVASVCVVEKEIENASFTHNLEEALIEVCHNLNIPIPLWLSKNTHEFAAFRQTIFFKDQFTEKTNFDRFQIRLL